MWKFNIWKDGIFSPKNKIIWKKLPFIKHMLSERQRRGHGPIAEHLFCVQKISCVSILKEQIVNDMEDLYLTPWRTAASQSIQ